MIDICGEQSQLQLSENKALPNVQSIHSLKVALTLKIWIILRDSGRAKVNSSWPWQPG